MDEANRFAPPVAAVADVAHTGEVQPIRFWPPSGRLGRLRFFAYGIGLYFAFLVLSAVVGGLASATRSGWLAGAVGILLFLVYMAAEVVLIVQRSHDMDLSGWWSIAAFIPLVGLFWVFKSGTQGANRWGAPPPPNSAALRTVTIVLAVLLGILVVAAIAVPGLLAMRR